MFERLCQGSKSFDGESKIEQYGSMDKRLIYLLEQNCFGQICCDFNIFFCSQRLFGSRSWSHGGGGKLSKAAEARPGQFDREEHGPIEKVEHSNLPSEVQRSVLLRPCEVLRLLSPWLLRRCACWVHLLPPWGEGPKPWWWQSPVHHDAIDPEAV